MSIIVSSGTVSVSSGVTSTGLLVTRSGLLQILNDGWAEEIELASKGRAVVSSGGILFVCTVSNGGTATVMKGGYAQNITVENAGLFLVSSGGTANKSFIQSGGTQIIYADVMAAGANVLNGGVFHVSSGGYAHIPVVSQGGTLCVWKGALIDEAKVYGLAEVNTSAAANNVSVFDGGRFSVMTKGRVHIAAVSSGGVLDVSSGGNVNSASVYAGGSVMVSAGGSSYNMQIDGGCVTLGGGTAAPAVPGAYLSSAVVKSGGSLIVSSGGTATGVKENGGWVEFEEGADVSFVSNTFSGLSLGDGQRATVHSGTTAADVTVTSGGTMHVCEGGMLAGTMTFEEGAAVSVGEGGTVAFDLIQTSAGAEALLNDFSLLQGTPLYTLTVETDLNDGIYRYALAGGAAAFDGVISVYREDGEDVGTLSVGETLFIGDTSYLLGILDAVLTLTVVVPDLTLPVVSDVQASTMAPTNQDVTVTAVFSDNVALAASLYRIGDGEWLEYKDPGVTVTDNATVFFKAVDTSGNESEIVSFAVTNIDKVAPVITLDGDDLTPAREVPLTAATEAGLDIFYSVDDGTWTKYDGVITVRANGSYSFRATDAANNTGTAEIVFANILPVAPENPAATKDRVSWDPNGAPKYVVEFSTDDFNHAFRAVTVNAAADLLGMPAGTYQWRVRAEDRDAWADGSDILSDGGSAGPKVLESNGDGSDDFFFAETAGTWGEWGYFSLAQHVGSVNDWSGTNELVFLDGKGRIQNLFFGSSAPNVLCLTDGENGEALFLDDVFTVLPEEIEEHQARVANIDEIRAGAGDDLIDLTSQRFEYTGDGLTIRGGDGDDVLWANKGGNFLFGDGGNDRLVGASGNDVIAGGAGDDSMHGGGGNDVFAFCDSWGADNVEQLATGSVMLWFASGDESNWNAETLTYTDGDNSITVKGVTADQITLKFGDDGSAQFATLSGMGAFFDATTERIFEESGKGILASL